MNDKPVILVSCSVLSPRFVIKRFKLHTVVEVNRSFDLYGSNDSTA